MAILCAVDFSETSALALACAREIADHYAQPLSVITVADPLLAAAEQMQAGRDSTAVMREALDEFVAERIGSGRSHGQHLLVRVGDAAEQVAAVAADTHAQLVVIGTQGSTGLEKAMFGSVAERVLRHTSAPVLVVPPAFGESTRHVLGSLREVLVPIDFHEHALEDARVAVKVARASHARLRLVHVLQGDEQTRWSLVPPFAAPAVDDQLGGHADAVADHALAALQRLAEALEVAPHPHVEVVEGDVAEQLAEQAARDSVDLVVMGLCRDVEGGARHVGRVAYRVLCSASTPVLALPPGAHAHQVLGFLGAA